MEEKQKPGTFKIDLSAQDEAEEQTSNLISPHKPVKPKTQELKTPGPSYIILGFIAMAIIFMAGYFSLKKAITAINTSGVEDMTTLSKDLNNKIGIVNQLIEEQKTSFKKELSTVDSKIKRVEYDAAKVKKFEKKNKSELQSSIAELKKKIDPLKKQLQDLKQQLAEISGITNAASNNIKKIQPAVEKNEEDIANLAASTIDITQLTADLKREHKSNQQAINSLANDIASLKQSITDLQKKINKLRSALSSASTVKTPPPSSQQIPYNRSSPIKKGPITEEEIH